MISLHNPNRRAHEFTIFDMTTLCVDIDPRDVPDELPWPHPDNPRISEVYVRSADDPSRFEFLTCRKRYFPLRPTADRREAATA